MAIVNRVVSVMVDDVSGLSATISVDYDNVAMRITALRVNNPTSRAILCTAQKTANGRIYSSTFPAGENTFISVPNNPSADRISISLDAQGRIVGIQYAMSWVL